MLFKQSDKEFISSVSKTSLLLHKCSKPFPVYGPLLHLFKKRSTQTLCFLYTQNWKMDTNKSQQQFGKVHNLLLTYLFILFRFLL